MRPARTPPPDSAVHIMAAQRSFSEQRFETACLINGGNGCYRQLSAKPSNPSGLREDYRPYDRRVPAFPASAGRQNRVYGSATTRFRRTGSILPGRFQFLGNRNGRLAGDCGLHQPVSQIWVPSSRPPVLSIIRCHAQRQNGRRHNYTGLARRTWPYYKVATPISWLHNARLVLVVQTCPHSDSGHEVGYPPLTSAIAFPIGPLCRLECQRN